MERKLGIYGHSVVMAAAVYLAPIRFLYGRCILFGNHDNSIYIIVDGESVIMNCEKNWKRW